MEKQTNLNMEISAVMNTTQPFVPNRKILYVDDEAPLLSSFASLMRRERVETFLLHNSQQIEKVLHEQGPFAAVFSDQRMPVTDGVAVLETVSRFHPDTVRVLVTGYADHADTIRAINVGGISHFIAKPWKDDDLRTLVRETIRRFNLGKENDFLLHQLKEANANLQELLDGTVSGTVHILRDMLTYLHTEAASQVERVRKLGLKFLELSPEIGEQERWEIKQALDLFNLGIGLLPAKAGRGEAGTPVTRGHATVTAELLRDIPRFDGVARIILLQNKNFDGTGQPASVNIAGKEIPLGARLLHVLLDLDMATRDRTHGRVVLEKMAQQPAKYDIGLIEKMLGGTTAQSLPSHPAESKCSVHELRPGMILLDNIVTESGQLLLKAGFGLTETSLKILLQWHANDPIASSIRVKVV
jgi:response regulator RpfG family c-di-GMP phosphodiesterase